MVICAQLVAGWYWLNVVLAAFFDVHCEPLISILGGQDVLRAFAWQWGGLFGKLVVHLVFCEFWAALHFGVGFVAFTSFHRFLVRTSMDYSGMLTLCWLFVHWASIVFYSSSFVKINSVEDMVIVIPLCVFERLCMKYFGWRNWWSHFGSSLHFVWHVMFAVVSNDVWWWLVVISGILLSVEVMDWLVYSLQITEY